MATENIFGSGNENVIYLMRILIACICGFIVGIERSIRQKDAGIRTHMIVAMGSALMMIISKYGFMDVANNFPGIRNADASRIASQIVSGVGFLGAGMIFINHKQSIKGLTTAAGIWATAGFGMAIGAGMYFVGICASVLMTAMQLLLHVCFKNIDNASIDEIKISFDNSIEDVNDFLNEMKMEKIDYTDMRISRNDDKNVTLHFSVKMQNENYDKLVSLVWNNEKIKSFSI